MSSDTLFNVHLEETGSTLRGTVVGELDMLTETDLVAVFGKAIDDTKASDIVLDLRQVPFMDSSGLRGLLRCRERVAEKGASLSLAVGPGPVSRLLDVSGVRDWFTYV